MEDRYSIIFPTKEIIFRDQKILIVDVPMSSIHRKQKEIHDIFNSIGVKSNDYMNNGTKYTWGEFYNDCLLVQQSLRKPESVKFDNKEINYGECFFYSLEDYIDKIGSSHIMLLDAVLGFRNDVLPDYNEITDSEIVDLVSGILSDDIVKKKRSIDIVRGFGLKTVTKLLDFMVEDLSKLRKENSRITTLLKSQNSSGINVKEKK